MSMSSGFMVIGLFAAVFFFKVAYDEYGKSKSGEEQCKMVEVQYDKINVLPDAAVEVVSGNAAKRYGLADVKIPGFLSKDAQAEITKTINSPGNNIQILEKKHEGESIIVFVPDCYVVVDGSTILNVYLVQIGYAEYIPRTPLSPYHEQFVSAGEQAVRGKVGMHKTPNGTNVKENIVSPEE